MKIEKIIILSIIIFVILNFISPLPLIPELKILPVILFVFFIPGYLTFKLFFNDHRSNILYKLSLIIAISLSIFIITILISYFFKLSYLQLILLISFIDLILIILPGIISYKKIPLIKERSNKDIFTVYILIIIIILTSLIAIYGLAITTDSMAEFPCIREASGQKNIIFTCPFYKNGFEYTLYKYNTLPIIYSLFSKMTGLDVIQVWYFLSILFTFTIIISFCFFIASLFNNYLLEIFSFTIFISFFCLAEGLWIFRTSPYYMIVTNFILLPNALSLFFNYLKERKKRYLLLFILLSISIGAIHLFAIFLPLLAISSYLFINLFFKDKEKIKDAILFLFPIIIFIIILIILKNLAFTPGQLETFKPQFLIKLSKNLSYIYPKYLFSPHYHIKPPFVPKKAIILAFLVLPVLFIYLKKYNWAKFLFSNMIVVPFILLNPIIPKYPDFIGKMVAFEAYKRLSQLLPIIPVLGTFVYFIFNKLRKNQLFYNKKTAYIIIIIIYLITFSYILFQPQKSLFLQFIKQKHKFKFLSPWDLNPVTNPYLPQMTFPDKNMLLAIKFIKKNIKQDSIFAANLNESMQILTFGKYYILAGFEAHIIPMNFVGSSKVQKEREEALKKILFQKGNLNETIHLLNKYTIDYILTNLNTDDKYQLKKFNNNSKYFSLIYNKDKILIYEFNNL